MERQEEDKLSGSEDMDIEDEYQEVQENRDKLDYLLRIQENNKRRSANREKAIEQNKDNEQFMDIVQNLQSTYNNPSNVLREVTSPKIIITEEDFELLSRFEKNTIRSIANMYGLLNDPTKEVDFGVMKQALDKLSSGRNDVEKNYLISLFFPEKIKNIHVIYPFPVPTFTYTQKFQIYVAPNQNGCFLAQVVCPMFLDNTNVVTNSSNNYVSGNQGSIRNPAIWNGNILGLQNGTAAAGTGSVSNIYVNNNAALNGTTLGLTTHFTPITTSQTLPGAFNTYILQSCKISAKYVGRGDVLSGYFGASYHLSPLSNKQPDPAPTQFDYVDDCINAVITDVTEGVNAVYYPADYSYMNFIRMNQDNVTGGQMSTNLRLNIYGTSLPTTSLTTSAPIVLTFVIVHNVIPTPDYADLLPLNYNIEQQTYDLLETAKFVPQSGLTTFKNSEIGDIERLLELPSFVRNNALKDTQVAGGRGRKTILDTVRPLTNPRIPPNFFYEKKLFTNLVEEKGGRKRNVDQLNKMLSGGR